jgi:hypothetical protein
MNENSRSPPPASTEDSANKSDIISRSKNKKNIIGTNIPKKNNPLVSKQTANFLEIDRSYDSGMLLLSFSILP